MSIIILVTSYQTTPNQLKCEEIERRKLTIMQQKHITKKHNLNPPHPPQKTLTLLQTFQIRIHAKKVERMTEHNLPRRDVVEIVQDLRGDLGVDVEECRRGRRTVHGGDSHGGEGVGDVFAREEGEVDLVAEFEGEG